MNDQIKARMLKILALAREGVGGEQENAERMLAALCKKHSVTVEQLEATGAIERYWFYVNTKYEKSLLFQCQHMCVSDTERHVWWKHSNRSRAVGFDLTPGEYAQLTVAFETFKASWLDNLDAFYTAFVWKNQIYGLNTETHDRELTEAEKEKGRKAAEMMRSIERTSLHKR